MKRVSEALQITAVLFIKSTEIDTLQKSFLSDPRYPEVLYKITFGTCQLGFSRCDFAREAARPNSAQSHKIITL